MKTAILVIALAESCSTSVPPENPQPEQSACERACLRMEELGCEEAQPDEDGTSCAVICEETQKAGLIDLEPEKIAESDSCP